MTPAKRDAVADILREAEAWRDATPEERDQTLAELCEAAELILANRPDREAVLAYQDPISETTRRLLARLRAEHGRV